MQIHKLCFLALFLAQAAFAIKFNFKSFTGNGLWFLGDAELGASSDGVGRSGAWSMTRDEKPFSHGQGLYISPIPFKPANDSTPYSFETSFTFSITPRTKPKSGQGLAFIIVPTVDNSAAEGGAYLGILNKTNDGKSENNVFFVEFDTFKNAKEAQDINGNHVGININSMTSNVATEAGYWVQTSVGKRKVWSFKNVNLSSGERFKAWIEFRSKDSRITVTIAPENVKKPKRPLLQGPRELNDVLLQHMYVGFAGSMGRAPERHDIWSWSFENAAKCQEQLNWFGLVSEN